jgi:hypothetical protein
MTDALRFDAGDPAGEVSERERNARFEELLLSGLDHYFSGQYELAINVWTRVLFLDRGHARARAYIERARGAIAERQREAEELVHTGAAALQRGEVDAARRLLTSAVEHGAETEEAIVLLGRVDRLEAAGIPQENRTARRPNLPREAPAARAGGTRRSRLAWIAAGALLGIAAGAVVVTMVWAAGDDWFPIRRPSTPVAAARTVDEPLRVPSTAEARMALACALHSKGRVREALAALDGIRPGDPVRSQADQLRAEMQKQLLAVSRGNPGTALWTPQGIGAYCR